MGLYSADSVWHTQAHTFLLFQIKLHVSRQMPQHQKFCTFPWSWGLLEIHSLKMCIKMVILMICGFMNPLNCTKFWDKIKLMIKYVPFYICNTFLCAHSVFLFLLPLPGLCMCSVGFPACYWMTCWSTGHPAVRRFWARGGVRQLVRGCAVCGDEPAAFLGNRVSPATPYLLPSALLSPVDVTAISDVVHIPSLALTCCLSHRAVCKAWQAACCSESCPCHTVNKGERAQLSVILNPVWSWPACQASQSVSQYFQLS